MGRFDPRYVTHLVLDDIVGSSKYENWKRHYDINLKCTAKTWKDGEEDDDRHHRQTTKTKYEYHEWADKLKVVTSAWVDACLAEGRRVDEEDYRLKEEGEGGGDENYLNEEQSRQALPATIRNASSEDKCDWMIQQQQQQRQCPVADDEYCNLFSRHSFILVGFDNDNDDDEGSATNTNNNNDNNDTTTIPTVDNVESSKVVVGDIHRESHMENSRAMTMTTTTTTARVSGVAIKQEDNRGLPSTSTSSTSSSLSNDKISTIRKKQSEIVKGKISKLIRRAGGTIFWEPNEWISIVVLNDHYSKRTWEDVRYFCREHPKRPICVGIDWILTCIYHRTKKIDSPPPFPSEPQQRNVQRLKRKTIGSNSTAGNFGIGGGGGGGGATHNTGGSSIVTKNRMNKKGPNKPPLPSSSSVFRGDVFSIVPVKSMPGTLEFHSKEMESTILANGGMVLSKSLLLAIKKDAAITNSGNGNNNDNNDTISNRKYFVVTPRWLQLDCATSFPLLAELSKVGIRVIPVSPVWVAACVKNNYKFNPEEYPILFQPQTWSTRLWKPSTVSSSTTSPSSWEEGGGKHKSNFLLSLTGFVDSSRYGIMSVLVEIGAEYTDNLSRKNTHLICKEARGAKYVKALEWGLHAVSVEWLYHVMRYGYREGSEDEFSLVVAKKRKEPVVEMVQQQQQQPATTSVKAGKVVVQSSYLNGKGNEKAAVMPSNTASAIDSQSKTATGRNRFKEQQQQQQLVMEEKSPLPAAQSSPPRRGKRDPPRTPSKEDRDHDDPPQSSAAKDDDRPSRRLQFALQTLEEGPPVIAPVPQSANILSPRRRGKRDRSPAKATSQKSRSLLSQPSEDDDDDDDDDEEEENTQMVETQFTTGTIRANADIIFGRKGQQQRCGGGSGGDSSEEVPLSQANDAKDNGESQVVWFAAPHS